MNSSSEQRSRPRFLPDEAFPSYTFVPGRSPHPFSDPAGHSHGREPPAAATLEPQKWRENRAFLRGVDLFNHGYYWEAHEAWESLWHACGRKGTTAGFLKGLIQLAAAGVKVREGVPAGVRTHARRALELFEHTAGKVGARFLGLSLPALIACAHIIADQEPASPPDAAAPVAIVFDFVLIPE